MNSTKSIIILKGLCFFQISHAVEKGIITKDKAGFVTSMRFLGNDKEEATVTPKGHLHHQSHYRRRVTFGENNYKISRV